MMHKFIKFLLHRYTDFRVIAMDGRGHIAGIGIPRKQGWYESSSVELPAMGQWK